MAQLPGHRLVLRSDNAVLTGTSTPDAELSLLNVPPEYQLAPTVPSPFSGTLEASLDAILVFGSMYPQLKTLTTPLLQTVDRTTDWLKLCQGVLHAHAEKPAQGRYLLEEFLFLITRTLLPEQIAENRRYMYLMYFAKRGLSNRVTLRYDMLRGWKMRSHAHPIVIDSNLPRIPYPTPPKPLRNKARPHRRALMLNVLPTLIAAKFDEPYVTKKITECMRHHVTDLDHYLLLTDGEVENWGTIRLLMAVAEVVLQWQWLRENTELMDDMDVRMWEDMDGKADESEWVKDTKNVKGLAQK
ncbi:hypothetical protein CC80DRAFT_411964 [Byssothecium circinans]|uniref:Uncharacterized protein n=1 Tax=Byssothecium circinans TaxID=147558 RepID=A0A6A5TZG6_9PLEO|nr:hypothetical protein CC80DRAFT_411964 [Byssothecium circinans]